MFIIKKCSTKGAFEAIPKKNLKLDFEVIKGKFNVTVYTPVVVLIKFKDCDISCYRNGRLLIKNCRNKEKAEKIAKEFYSRF